MRVFVCHASEDKPRVRQLVSRLRKDKFDPWLDDEKLLAGQDWEFEISTAIQQSEAVIVCLSTVSVEKTGYFQKELRRALDAAEYRPEGRIFMIPVRLEPCRVPEHLSHWQYADLFLEDGYERLRGALTTRASELLSQRRQLRVEGATVRRSTHLRRSLNRLETLRFDTWRNDDKHTILRQAGKIITLGDRVILPSSNGGGSLYYVGQWAPEIVNVCDDLLRMVESGRKTKDSNAPLISKLGALGDSLATILRFSALPVSLNVLARQPFLSQETAAQLDQILSRLINLMRQPDMRDRFVEDKAVRREVHSEERARAAYDAMTYGVSTLIDFRNFRSKGATHMVANNFENILFTRISRNKAITNAVIYMWWLAMTSRYEKAILFGKRSKTLLMSVPELPSGNAAAIIHSADDCEHDFASALANLHRTLGNAEIMCAVEAGRTDRPHHIQKARQYIDLADTGYNATTSVWRHGIANLTLSRAAVAFVEQKYGDAHRLFADAVGIFHETGDLFKTLKIMDIVGTEGKGVGNIASFDLRDLLFLE